MIAVIAAGMGLATVLATARRRMATEKRVATPRFSLCAGYCEHR